MMSTLRRAAGGAALVAAVLVTGFRPAADPAAVLVQVTGDVQLQRAGTAAPAPAALGASLAAGDRIIVATGAKAVLLYRTGRSETATASLTITAPETQQPGGLFDQTVKTIGQVATTDARKQPNRQGMIRPVAGEAVPIAPRNGVHVVDGWPTLTWFSISSAAGYMVQLRRIDDAGTRPVRFHAGTDTTFTLPADAAPLVAGAEYEWTVAAVPSGRPATVQRFRVLDAAGHAVLAARLDAIRAAGLDPAGDGAFLAALAYRDAGAHYHALRKLDRIAADTTPNSRAYHLLRAEVLDAIGDIDGAAAAFAAADAAPAE
jgi:hypothetical protein